MTASRGLVIAGVSLVGIAAVLAAGLPAADNAYADTVFLKRGGSLEGKVVEGDGTVDVIMKEGSTTFNKADIDRIEKDPATVESETSWKGTFHNWRSFASSLWAKTKIQWTNIRHSVQKKTSKWSQPVGHKEPKSKSPYTIKKISAQEKKRIS